MKHTRKISLFLSICFLLSSCDFLDRINPFNKETNQIDDTALNGDDIIDENPDDEDIDEPEVTEAEIEQLFDDLEDIEENIDDLADEIVETTSALESKQYDCPMNFTFNVVSELDIVEVVTRVAIYDINDQEVTYTMSPEGKENTFKVKNIAEYIPGGKYVVNIDEGVYFENKDPEIRSFCFTIARESENKIEVSNAIHYFPLSGLVDFPESEESHYFIYNSNFNLNKGDIFCLSQDNKPTSESFLAEFDYSEKSGSNYKIYYADPDLSRVYDYIDVNNEELINFDEVEAQFANEEEIEREIRQNPQINRLERAYRDAGGKRAFKDVFKFEVKITRPTSSSVKANLVAQTKLKLPGSQFYFYAKAMFSLELSLRVKSDIYIKRTPLLGIPWGLYCDISCYLKSEKITSFTAGIAEGKDHDNNFFTLNTSKIEQQLASIRENPEGNPYTKILDDNSAASTDKKYDLVNLNISVCGLASLKINLGFELHFEMFGLVSYTRKEVREDLIGGYNTDSGFNSSSQPTASSNVTSELYLGGRFSLSVGPYASFSFALFGLSWLFSMGVDAMILPKVALDGLYFTNGTTTIGGATLTTCWNYSVSYRVTFIGKNNSGSISKGEFGKTITTFGSQNFDFWYENNHEFSIDEDVINLKTVGVFDVMRFDPDSGSVVQTRYNPQTGYIESPANMTSNRDKHNFVLQIISGSEYLKVSNNGNISYINNPLSFKAKIRVSIIGKNFARSYDIVLNFLSKDASYVSIDGDGRYYRKGETILLPTLDDNGDSLFRHWKDNKTGSTYNGGTSITLSRNEYEFVSIFSPAQYFTVRFFNGNGVLISSQSVRERKSAIEPTEAERDIPGYKFIAWDIDFSYVEKNLDIYGIYVRVVEA